jgi:hypothetical protein
MFEQIIEAARTRFPQCLLAFLVAAALVPASAYDHATYERDLERLASYRGELKFLRDQGRPVVSLSGLPSFLFGMGDRQKYIYRNGELIEWPSLRVVKKWTVKSEVLIPPAYTVWIRTPRAMVRIHEDEHGLWVEEGSKTTRLAKSFVHLPSFRGALFPNVLRTLHHDILVNIVKGKPLPNFLVYAKPWYRDAAMTAMVLKRTGNIALIRTWILSIRDPFDRNNGGIEEADNLGEVLYLVSCVSNRQHPVVEKVLDSVESFRRGTYIIGRTDFSEHPVYQTKWLKVGLKSLGLQDPFVVPVILDSYASLFWWDFKDGQAGPPFPADAARKYPYLAWARDHLTGTHDGPVSSADYPITWETDASQANYAGQRVFAADSSTDRTATPHSWHAAEMFLLLASDSGGTLPAAGAFPRRAK